jgi:hypothetical protein
VHGEPATVASSGWTNARKEPILLGTDGGALRSNRRDGEVEGQGDATVAGRRAAACVALAPAFASTLRMVCLVVDLEGDGLRLGDRNYPVPFDVDGDGLRESLQWTASEQREGFLWLDANHDGAMQPGELLGRRLATPDGPSSSHQSGWRALADLDLPSNGGDGDGQLTAADRAWSELRLWIDYDHDGDPDRAELYRLEDWRIESFALDFTEGLKVDGGLNLETAWASVTVRPRGCERRRRRRRDRGPSAAAVRADRRRADSGSARVENQRICTAWTAGSRIRTSPLDPSTATRAPPARSSVARATPNTAGMPSSRATTAAWHIAPPTSITSAAARGKSGVHPGSA